MFAVLAILGGSAWYNRALAEVSAHEAHYVQTYQNADTALASVLRNRTVARVESEIQAERLAQAQAALAAQQDAKNKQQLADTLAQAQAAARAQQEVLAAQRQAQLDAQRQQMVMTVQRTRTTRAS